MKRSQTWTAVLLMHGKTVFALRPEELKAVGLAQTERRSQNADERPAHMQNKVFGILLYVLMAPFAYLFFRAIFFPPLVAAEPVQELLGWLCIESAAILSAIGIVGFCCQSISRVFLKGNDRR